MDTLQQDDTPVFFFSSKKAYGEFSNFADFAVELDGYDWPTVEHYYQAQKFHDPAYQALIRAAGTPKMAAFLGRNNDQLMRPDWAEVKDEVMYAAVWQKCRQHQVVRDLLLGTGEREIIEQSPTDFYWGCGADGSGENRLGQILMQVRTRLRHTPA